MDDVKDISDVIPEQLPQGAFVQSLKRNNRQIREDRAETIVEETELVYKRRIEDLGISISRMKKEQENMLDLSPTTAQSLVLASDFDNNAYVDKDVDLSIKIRNEEIKRDLAVARYKYLFGKEIK